MSGTLPTRGDIALLRRYLTLNVDTYRVDSRTLAPVEGSYQRAVLRDEALAALDRVEAACDNA